MADEVVWPELADMSPTSPKDSDPWAAKDMIPDAAQNNGDADLVESLPDSDRYVASLESKLNRLKGRTGREATSRDLINALVKVKDTHMTLLEESDSFHNNFTVNPAATDSSSTIGDLQRWLYPERQALSEEELQALLTSDQLAKLQSELFVDSCGEDKPSEDKDELASK